MITREQIKVAEQLLGSGNTLALAYWLHDNIRDLLEHFRAQEVHIEVERALLADTRALLAKTQAELLALADTPCPRCGRLREASRRR